MSENKLERHLSGFSTSELRMEILRRGQELADDRPLPTRLMTIEEVSEYISVSVPTIRQWRVKRTGPTAIRVGKHLRYRRDDVEQWVEANRETSGLDRDELLKALEEIGQPNT